jgi:hypothetical protein
MRQTSSASIEPWVGDATGRTQPEIVLREILALIGAVLLGVLRIADAVVEAWPLPGSRVPK